MQSVFIDGAATFGLTLVSELGDKSQLLLIALATRWPRWPVAVGGLLGVAIVQLLAVLVGGWMADQPWRDSLPTVVGAAFVVLGLITWFGSGDSGEDEQIDPGAEPMGTARVTATTAVVLFLAELGDKTMFTTAALAATRSPVAVLVGAAAAFTVLAIAGVTIGARLTDRFDGRLLTRAAAALFVVLGGATMAAG